MKRLLLLIPLCLICLATYAQQPKQSSDTIKLIPRKVDSTLMRYYNWCNAHRREPSVLLTTDTMYNIAESKGDTRMQIVALVFKADHYYATRQIDSLKAWLPRIERFARKNNQLRHYYFVWSRLILHYTRHGQYTMAQFELERYAAMAAQDGAKEATADAYVQLAHIYRTKSLARLAGEYYQKAIDYVEQNDLDRFGLSNYYIALSTMLIQIGDFEGAAQAIEKGKQNLGIPDHYWSLRAQEAVLLAQTGRAKEAYKILLEIQDKYDSGSDASRLFEIKAIIFKALGMNDRALQSANDLLALHESLKKSEYDQSHAYVMRAGIYANLGQYMNAYDDLLTYVKVFQKRVVDQNETSLDEFATLLDVNRLERERVEFQQQAQDERLARNKLVILALSLIIALALLVIIAEMRSRRRLERAKRAADQANLMKSSFIHTVTHEINTPLNAIVGFAELAATVPPSEQDGKAYIDIIHQNSRHLQRLVSNVLYISDMESMGEITDLRPVDLNACLRECIKQARLNYQGNIEIEFKPAFQSYHTTTSELYLSKIVTELLSNALQFTLQGVVELAYTIEPTIPAIQITVTDTGCGVPTAQSGQIFERFVKLDTFSEGLGLGLAVCELAAKGLGGRIELDTQYQDGARFIVTLPLVIPRPEGHERG